MCSISDNNLKRGFHKFIYKTLWSKIAEVNMFVRCTWFTCLLCMHVATCVRYSHACMPMRTPMHKPMHTPLRTLA